jgi:hypothetical protein
MSAYFPEVLQARYGRSFVKRAQDIFYQMGNIGSEVGRALSAKRRGKDEWMTSAFYRGMDFAIAARRGL